MSDISKTFIKSINTLFPGATITLESRNDSMNGQILHNMIIEGKLSTRQYDRTDVFERSMGLGIATGHLSGKHLKITSSEVELRYEIYIHPDVDSFMKEFNDKVSWHVFSQEFDAAVEEELVQK